MIFRCFLKRLKDYRKSKGNDSKSQDFQNSFIKYLFAMLDFIVVTTSQVCFKKWKYLGIYLF